MAVGLDLNLSWTIESGAVAVLPLNAGVAQASGSVALSARAILPLGSGTAQASASLTISARAILTLGSGVAQASGSLSISPRAILPLNAGVAQASGSLALVRRAFVPLGSSTALASGLLAITGGAIVSIPHAKLTILVTEDVGLKMTTDERMFLLIVTETLNPGAQIDEVPLRHKVEITEKLNLLASVTELALSLSVMPPISEPPIVSVDERPYLVSVDEVN